MDRIEIENKVMDILHELLPESDNGNNIDKDEFLDEYGMSSSIILKLIIRIENEFDFRVSDDDFDEKNFETVESIVMFVEKKNA